MSNPWTQALPKAADEAAIRADLQRLRAMLDQWLPDHAEHRTEVTPQPHLPQYMRLFWEVIGHSPALNIGPPSAPEHNDQQLKHGIAYLKKAARSPITRSNLPDRCQFIELIEHDPYGMIYTDDTKSKTDPPLYVIGGRRKRPELLSRSYMRWCTSALVSQATKDWLHSGVRMVLSTPPDPAFEVIAPWCHWLGPELWLDPGPAGDGEMRRITCRNTTALIAHVLESSFQDYYLPMALGCGVGNLVEVSGAHLTELKPLAQVKRWQTLPPGSADPVNYAAGHIEDIPVMVAEHAQTDGKPNLALLVDKENDARLLSIVQQALPDHDVLLDDCVGEIMQYRRQLMH